MFIDVHTHKNAEKEGEIRIFNAIFGRNEADWLTMPHSLGLHPWYLPEKADWQAFAERASEKKVCAIGECGLDKAINAPIAAQLPFFIEQIKIAESLNLPVIVHSVRAYNEVLGVIKNEKPKIPLILHGFNKNMASAKPFLDHNVYFSFGKSILKENIDGVILKEIYTQNKLFLETDVALDVSIKTIYDSAAQHIEVDIALLESRIETVFRQVFNF